jgi:formate hydrogenlyase subunit 6/NADH:ubiquinone oxidoreductase subunit I
MLSAMGLGGERLSMQFMSAAMGSEFARVAQNITDTARKLGPNPLKNTDSTVLFSDNKRENLRAIMLSIIKGLGNEPEEFLETLKGFGESRIDTDKCLGCGACVHVCLNEAMKAELRDDLIRLTHEYWKCTACGNCMDACPKECMEVVDSFDLPRFLSDEKRVKMETGALSCRSCGRSFLPLLLEEEVRKVIDNDALTESYIELCPSCRRFLLAERIKTSLGFRGQWKKIHNRGKSTA